MAEELKGRQVINLSENLNSTVKNLGRELSGADLQEKRNKMILDHIFCFTGLAGGVGTSTLVANTAFTLKKLGYSVLIIDTNIMYPIQHSFFRIKQEVSTKDFFSFLYGECSLGECIKYPMGNDLGVMLANNRGLIDFVDTETKESANAFIECLERVGSLFDFVLIDTGNNLGSELTNAALYKADKIIAVMDENIECLSNYNRLTGAMGACGIDYTRIKTVMNKRTSIQYTKSIFKDFGIDLIAVLPFDLAIICSGLKGEIFCQKGESMSRTAAAYAKGVKEFAQMLVQISGGAYKEENDEE